jgi:Fur family ferric uptake transcriptional regulator
MNLSENNWPEGVKRTRQRECVLAVLEEATKPLSAVDIFTLVNKRGCEAWLSTIYRILERFEEKKVVLKTTVASSDMTLYVINRMEHKHYALCLNCHIIIPIDHCPMNPFIPQLEEGEFQITGHHLEIFGLCKKCQSEEKSISGRASAARRRSAEDTD